MVKIATKKSPDVTSWIGWVEDSGGYMVSFVPPTTRPAAGRRVECILHRRGELPGEEGRWESLQYALSRTLVGHEIDNEWFRKLPDADRQALGRVLEEAKAG